MHMVCSIDAKALARKRAPRPMTTKKKIAIGKRQGINGTEDPFYDVDAFTTFFPDIDLLGETLYDIAHGLGNNLANTFSIVLNKGQYAYSAARRVYEQVTLQRFQDYKAQERMPWFICPRALAKGKQLEKDRYLKVPTSWEPIFMLFTNGVPTKVHKYTCIYT